MRIALARLAPVAAAALAGCEPDRVASPDVNRLPPQLLPTSWSEWSTPVELGPPVNTEFLEQGSAISKDGLSLYFQSDRPGGLGAVDLYVSQRTCTDDENAACAWGTPRNLGSTVNSAFGENAPKLSPDEHLLYFVSTRPGGYGGLDLWVSRRQDRRDDFGWEAPINLGAGVNSASADNQPEPFDDPVTGEQRLYFVSNRPGGMGLNDIYVSTRGEDGTFGTPSPVTELNSGADDFQPELRRDGLELFMASSRGGGFGNFDIYVLTRAAVTNPWSNPQNLGATLNTTASEARPILSWDGTTLYFQSNRSGDADLYRTTRHKEKPQ